MGLVAAEGRAQPRARPERAGNGAKPAWRALGGGAASPEIAYRGCGQAGSPCVCARL